MSLISVICNKVVKYPSQREAKKEIARISARFSYLMNSNRGLDVIFISMKPLVSLDCNMKQLFH